MIVDFQLEALGFKLHVGPVRDNVIGAFGWMLSDTWSAVYEWAWLRRVQTAAGRHGGGQLALLKDRDSATYWCKVKLL
ncbi:MAG: hypothetical protein CMQ15_08130 [Gammaproteobacteria bacterium]|jgi:hypothetical protein|nr:hypothetical protein [Gammaproteobacteria bacterium]